MCLLSLCLHAWSSVVTSPPGDTVSLNCLYSTNSSSDNLSMFWYRQLSGRPPEPILQSFSPDGTFSYSYLRAGEHFTLEKNHTLVIRNVTRDDIATYYCSKLETDVCRFGDGIELRVDGESVSIFYVSQSVSLFRYFIPLMSYSLTHYSGIFFHASVNNIRDDYVGIHII
uniref:Ig-like domain-containing protein n=1 Tax=Erpetoichthys calabaricus TaxID=27687 RepID=A0A8C4TAG2_ERPCA